MVEFPGITPSDIDDFTINQVAILSEQINKRRKDIFPTDMGIQALYLALLHFMGANTNKGSESKKDTPLEVQTEFPVAKLSAKELDAYTKAGMPSPFTAWLARYRKEHKNG